MKVKVFSVEGEAKKELDVPKCFGSKIRADIVVKALRSVTTRQSYGAYVLAGKEVSASGVQRHARRAYKGIYGLGISRVPRKTTSSKGTRFTRVGAFMPGSRGGRRAHPPKVDKIWTGSINKKEKKIAMNSLIAATASAELLKKMYPKIDFSKLSLPIVVEDKVAEIDKTKKLKDLMKKIFGNEAILKKSRTILLVSEKSPRSSFVESAKAEELNLLTLAPAGKPGRVVVYTEGAIEKLRKK